MAHEHILTQDADGDVWVVVLEMDEVRLYPFLGACPRKKLLKNKALELRSEGIKISHFLETRVLARGQDFFAFLKNS